MLEAIKLSNFKASRTLPQLRLAPLTLLSGLNGSGKSSLLQAIALLKQSYSRVGRIDSIRIRGALVQLGSFGEILSDAAEVEQISIDLKDGGKQYSWKFSAGLEESVASLQTDFGNYPSTLVNDGFQMLHADRIVPQSLYPRSASSEFGSWFLGARGEFTAEILTNAHLQGTKVSEKRRCPTEGLFLTPDLVEKAAPTLGILDQVSGWIQQLCPGAQVFVEFVKGTDEVVIQFRFVGREGLRESDRRIRPVNVGFGLTYSLPIITACLLASPGSLLLLENPEAHLHPQGQFALGELLARTAADGVQLIVETHSDHLLNGARVAVKRRLLDAERVAVHHFRRDPATGDVQVESPALLGDGRLAAWPAGFFDQWDISLDRLLEDR